MLYRRSGNADSLFLLASTRMGNPGRKEQGSHSPYQHAAGKLRSTLVWDSNLVAPLECRGTVIRMYCPGVVRYVVLHVSTLEAQHPGCRCLRNLDV